MLYSIINIYTTPMAFPTCLDRISVIRKQNDRSLHDNDHATRLLVDNFFDNSKATTIINKLLTIDVHLNVQIRTDKPSWQGQRQIRRKERV